MNNSATLPSMPTESVDRLIYLLTEKDGIHIHQRLANLETSVANRFPVFLNILVCGDIEKFLAGDSYTIVRGLNTVLNIHRDGDLSVHNTQAIARIAFELFLGLMRTIKPIRDTVRYMNLDTEFSGLSTWCVWSHPYHPLKEIKRVLTEFSDEESDAFDYVEVIDAYIHEVCEGSDIHAIQSCMASKHFLRLFHDYVRRTQENDDTKEKARYFLLSFIFAEGDKPAIPSGETSKLVENPRFLCLIDYVKEYLTTGERSVVTLITGIMGSLPKDRTDFDSYMVEHLPQLLGIGSVVTQTGHVCTVKYLPRSFDVKATPSHLL